jgi:hypothetical protein
MVGTVAVAITMVGRGAVIAARDNLPIPTTPASNEVATPTLLFWDVLQPILTACVQTADRDVNFTAIGGQHLQCG